ncbi:pyridoxamine 5'-phosphate oxidase family protein [Glycomyces terrestris]|uniref:Pyridoxamine 5'-phosphate oxidase family protein n=1 Tax=Glycomyces terrestris TaxID=2493553 RepID=A0A426V3J6_9ACTN|nr:pyridoxamine 5'-phosphate oxidase family protein [Glycomyces terrestris]RRS01436.1 pyridoxamine 5'-phosphate oxidase family protein [Glycomyces terrestris]
MEHERKPVELRPEVAKGYLTHAEFGRVAFIVDGLPVIRPLNHVVVEGDIIVHTSHDSAFAQAVRARPDLPVAYETDEIEAHSHTGWSVLVRGTATDITGHPRAAQLGRQVPSWIDRPHDAVIAIRPHQVTGLRLTIGH